MINVTTEAEFINLLPKNNEYLSAQNINKSILKLKQEQLDILDRINLLFGKVPEVWNDTTSYSKGEIVQHNGMFWISLIANTNTTPEEGPIWEKITYDLNAQKIAYDTFIPQDNDPATPIETIWTLPRTDNEILYTEEPTNVFLAINALDRLKANKNGNVNEPFLVLDSSNDNSAVSKLWAVTNLNNKADKNGNSNNVFDVANPLTNHNAANKAYVDQIKIDLETNLNNKADKNGNSNNVFDVANPIVSSNAANKAYVDMEIRNIIANGSNNIIRKVDKIINAYTVSETEIGITMNSGQVMVFSGSILMYEGQDYNIVGSKLYWLKDRIEGERITVLFLEENALTGILDSIYLKQSGGSVSGNISCDLAPSNDAHLVNKMFVETKKSEVISYTNTKIDEVNNYLVPKGGIIAFSGTEAEVASLAPYWYICDGTNNTPDLRGRFILGSGTNISSNETYIVGQIGGSSEKNITIDNMPPHNHELLMGQEGPSAHDSTGYNELTLKPVAPGSGNTTVVNTSGSGIPMNIMPPYYTLVYIMRAKD